MKATPRGTPIGYPPSQDLIPNGTVFYCDILDMGNVGTDLSGNKNNVLWSGTVNQSKLYGNCKKLNGSTANGTISNNPGSGLGLDILKPPVSVFTWIKPTAASQNPYIFAKCNSGGSLLQYALLLDTYNYRIQTYLNGYSGTTSNNTIALNNWYMIGFTWDGTHLQFYINGLPSGSPKTYSSATLTTQPGIYVSGPAGNRMTGYQGEIWVIKNTPQPADVKSLFLDTAWKYGVEL